MFSKLEFMIASRYLGSKRKEGFISVTALFSFFGIMIGVATLIIVMSVMNGFREDLIERILGINSHITIYGRGENIKNYEQIVARVSAIKGVKSANPLVEDKAMFTAASRSTGGLVKGIRVQDLENKELIAKNVTGDYKSLKKKDRVLIGYNIASSMGLEVGDKIKIISAQMNSSILGSIPRIKTYKVGGIFESGMHEYDSTTIFMNFDMAKTHFRLGKRASAVEVFLDDIKNIDEMKLLIFNNLIDFDNLFFVDWQQSNASFIEALNIERMVMFLILTLIILVAAFNIISSMIMLVKDKNKNIALLRTMGMTRKSILRIFLICGSSIGFVGTLLGIIIGVAFSANIEEIKLLIESLTGANLFNPAVYFLSKLPSKILISDVLMITLMSLGISFLATIYPAYKASKADPAEILRYE